MGEKPVDKKKWIILFSIIGVVIVGLIIAIVVALNLRSNSDNGNGGSGNNGDGNSGQSSQTGDDDSSYEEAVQIRESVHAEIGNIMLERAKNKTGLTDQEMMDFYRQKIDETTNNKAKLLIMIDYYLAMLGTDTDGSKEAEILNALIEIDNKLKVYQSAVAVSGVADYYNNQEIKDKYNKILEERLLDGKEFMTQEEEDREDEETAP